MIFTKHFRDLSKIDAAIAGGKGASLGEMTSAFAKATAGQAGGHNPVPPGFVVLAGAFERFCEETDLNVEIDTVLHTVNHREMHTVDGASEKIQALILAAKMPADITKEIEQNFKILGAKFVAVRSSATAEDSSSAAWAGQLDSFLNTTEKDVLEKVKRCWASLFTPRAIFYRFEKELHKTKISVAVVVQKMVESEVSGIAFSVHPVTEDYNQMIIEAGLGLGEAIVSGQITPDSYVVEKNPRRIIDANVSTQERGLFRKTGGGNVWADIPAAEGSRQKLSEKQILELSEVILHIEKHYGFPCDIEWALEVGKFYIVQSRPITTLKAASAVSEQKKSEELWSSNYSIEDGTYQLAFPMVDFGIPEMQKVFLGKNHPYVLSKHFVYYNGIKIEGGYYLDSDLQRFADTINAMIYDEPEKIFENHKKSYALNDDYMAFAKQCLQKNLPKLSNKQIADLYFKLTVFQERAHLWPLPTTWFVDSYGAVFSTGLLERTKEIVAKAKSKRNPADVFSILTTPAKNSFGIEEEIESLAIVAKIQKDKKAKAVFLNLRDYGAIPKAISPALKRAMISHCKKWQWTPFGYHGPAYEMDYYLSVWSGLVREGIKADKLIAEKKQRPQMVERERRLIFKELKISGEMKKVYDIGADITFLKGYRKDTCYYGFFAVGYFFKEISKRLNVPLINLHMLTYLEICDILNGKARYDAEEIEKRKQAAIQYWDGEKIIMLSGDEAEAFFKSKSIKKEMTDLGSDTFKGTCACSGYAKGIVKIVNKPEEMGKMNRGDIMVSHTTYPSLVPAMKKAAAIVTEDGGITCHAAIVARELKTPCVTGIKVITQVVKDGDEVEVDADNGVVRIVAKAPEPSQSGGSGAQSAGREDLPVPFGGQDEWMLAENIPDMDMFFGQIFMTCFTNDYTYPFLKNYTETIAFYKGFGMDFYFGKKDSYEVGESIVKALVERPNFGNDVNKNIVLWSKKLVDFATKVSKLDLSKKTNSALWKLFKKHDQIHTKLYTFGWLSPAVDMFHNNFTDHLKAYLRTVTNDNSEVEKAFVILCTPSRKTIIAKEREDFLATLDQNLAEIKKTVSSGKLAPLSAKLEDDLEKHSKEWGHLGYIYSGKVDPFGPDHYLNEMVEFVKNGFTSKKVLEQEEEQLKVAAAKKREIVKRLKISKKYENLFEVANDFALTKLIRRDAQLRDMLLLHRSLLNEIAKRLKISRDEVQLMLKGEIHDGLEKNILDKKAVFARLTEPCALYSKKGFEHIYTGKDLEVLKQGIKTNIDQTITEFKGQTAQPGFATGTVKIIIRAKDMAKMNQGDILVSIATDPDIVPAMKKAAAIVTEQGGITSHAAIVSRELGTPCIIGTKIATKILKDGDIVEVDADNGVVRIIKNA